MFEDSIYGEPILNVAPLAMYYRWTSIGQALISYYFIQSWIQGYSAQIQART
jgi:hypothetical protein